MRTLLEISLIEDKIGFECVSKQCKKLIFNKQKAIELQKLNKHIKQSNNAFNINKLLVKNNTFLLHVLI